MYKVIASDIFKSSVQRFRSFLAYKYGDEFAQQQITLVKQTIQEILPDNSEIAPISSRLLEIGVSDYRQWLIDKHNLIFYKIDKKNNEVHLLALIDSRQNIQKLLFEVMLIS